MNKKPRLFTNCSFWLTAFVKHAMIKKKKTTLQLVLGHSNLAKKKSWLVESLNLNCHLTISTNSTHKHDEPGCSCMRTKSIGISRHIDRFLFALWKRSTLSCATQIATWRPCCLSYANTSTVKLSNQAVGGSRCHRSVAYFLLFRIHVGCLSGNSVTGIQPKSV